MAIKTKSGLWNKLKTAAAYAAAAFSIGAMNPARAGDIEVKAKLSSGSIEQVMKGTMGGPFSSGHYHGLKIDANIPFESNEDRGFVDLKADMKLSFNNYKSQKGHSNETETELSAMVRREFDYGTWKGVVSFGANANLMTNEMKYEGDKITLDNFNAGPKIIMGLGNDIAFLNFEYGLGLGQAGNDVHGRGFAMQHQIRLETGFDTRYGGITAYAGGKLNDQTLNNVDRLNGRVIAGGEAKLKFIEHFAAGVSYEHNWNLGDTENTEADIIQGVLEVKF